MFRVENVATPFTAGTITVPESVPPPGFVPIVTVTLPLKPVVAFPRPSWALTTTAGAIATPAVALLGWTVNASWLGVPGVMLKAALVAPVTPVAAAASVYPVPALLILKVEKLATPLTAATLTAPESVPALGLLPIATVTFPVNPVAVFPCASRAVTCTAGAIATPAVAALGCTVNTSCVAAAGVTVKPALVAGLRPLVAAVSV